MRSLDRVQLEQWLRWVRARPWQVWATAGAVFLLFAVLGAVTRGPATVPVAAHSLSDGLERGTGSPAAPEPPATTEPGQDPGVADRPDAPPPTTASAPTPTTSAYFANCTDAEAAGAAPIPRGQPGYRPELDRDGDGVACDPAGSPSSTPTTAPTSPTPAPTTTPPAPPPTTASPTPTPTAPPTTTQPPGVN